VPLRPHLSRTLSNATSRTDAERQRGFGAPVGESGRARGALENRAETRYSNLRPRNSRRQAALRPRPSRPLGGPSSLRALTFPSQRKVAPQVGHGYKCSLFAADREVGGKRDGVAKGPALCLTPRRLRHQRDGDRRLSTADQKRIVDTKMFDAPTKASVPSRTTTCECTVEPARPGGTMTLALPRPTSSRVPDATRIGEPPRIW
jgi:hypothetical protein